MPLIPALLTYAARGAPEGVDPGSAAEPPNPHDLRQYRWALEGGQGPLLHRSAKAGAVAVAPAWRAELLAFDLTARVRQGAMVEAAMDVVALCVELGVPATLLKGTSIGTQWYPAEHLRPMADIDVLIPTLAYSAVESGLLDRGYVRVGAQNPPWHQHGTPLRHARSGTVVELHTKLFADGTPMQRGTLFGPANILSQSVDSSYKGLPVRRLSTELQLAYIAVSWFNDMTSRFRFRPSYLASLFDAVFLLQAEAHRLRWDVLVDANDNEMARASLYVMLSYLLRYGIDAPPPGVLPQLAKNGGWAGPLQRRLIQHALDRYLVGARPWPYRAPPPVPGRYSLRPQFEKRVLARLRNARA